MGRRRGSDPSLLWIWCRPAATALIGPLAWKSPHAVGVALEMAKRKKKGSSVAANYGVGHTYSLDPTLLWLGCRPAATAPIQPLAWEPPYAVGVALKKTRTHTHTHKSEVDASAT